MEGTGPGRLLFLIFIALAVVLPVRRWVAEPIYIATASMEPTLPVGRHLYTDKISVRLRGLKRGDIIVFHPPVEGEPGDFVKRVIALPGETIELKEKKVFVNSAPLDEPYARHDRPNDRLEGDTLGPLTVPKDQLFVLGDNRDESKDSSVWKDDNGQHIYFLPISSVVGIVRGVY